MIFIKRCIFPHMADMMLRKLWVLSVRLKCMREALKGNVSRNEYNILMLLQKSLGAHVCASRVFVE